jgi:hexosaminidase
LKKKKAKMKFRFWEKYYLSFWALFVFVGSLFSNQQCVLVAVAKETPLSSSSSSVPRLFPAAKQELYDPQTYLLRIFEMESVSFACQHSTLCEEDRVLKAAKERFVEFLQHLPDYPDEYPVNPQKAQLVPLLGVKINVQQKNSSRTDNVIPHGFDESYQIQIDSKNEYIMVESQSVFGIVRGLESLVQLIEFGWMDQDKSFPVFIIRNTPLYIADAPTYPYRGLMIDTGRHYQPLDLILANLDVMGQNKFNVLHWHITDDQSWPFVSETFPELSEKGAYSKHAIYSHADAQRVIEEGYLRGIRVIPEFDLPGHSQVLNRSHPELMSHCANAQPLDPTLPEVYDFVEKLYQEVTQLFPDKYIHIGGDEVRLDCWKHVDSIQKWAKAHDMTEYNLLNYFESILTDIVASCGKTPIVWQELLNEGVDLPTGTVIDVWKGFDKQTIQNATKRHYPVVISGCWYLDHLTNDWKSYYNCEPLDFNGTHAQKQLVMGGHASMWGERVDATDFMARVWPRASAVAERLWSGSPPKSSYHELLTKTVQDRITKFRCLMVLRGVTAAPIGPGSCPHEQPYLTKTTPQSPITTVGRRQEEMVDTSG